MNADDILAAAASAQNVDALHKLEREVARLRVDVRSANGRADRLRDELVEAERRIEFVEATYDPSRRYSVSCPVERKKAAHNTFCVAWSDWHLEEKVDPAMCGGNKHDLTVAKERNRRIVRTTAEIAKSQRAYYPFDDLVIWLGGDLINGAIHAELEETNFLGPTEAVLFAQDMVLGSIEYMVQQLDPKRLTIVCNYGNHGRTTIKTRHATGHLHSWEYLAYHNMARLMAAQGRKCEWIISKGGVVEVDIQGVPLRFTHGDSVKFAGGVGGITIPLKKKIANWDKRKPCAMTVLGHFHQHVCDWDFLVNGCTVGLNPYALNNGFAIQPPTQSTFIVNRHRGVVDISRVYAA